MTSWPVRPLTTVLSALSLAAVCACSGPGPDASPPAGATSTDPTAATAPLGTEGGLVPLDPGTSLSRAGVALAERAGLADRAPAYDVRAAVDPGTGSVSGVVRASLPVGADTSVLRLRYLAGLEVLETDAAVGTVVVDGRPAPAVRDESVVELTLPDRHGSRVEVVVPFSYTLPRLEPAGLLDALGGIEGPADVGLLGRHDDVVNLGHWFPLWVPEGGAVDPAPAGYGDIGNFPAALVRLELTVPRGWQVVDGGVPSGRRSGPDGLTVTSEGYGMNELAVSLLRRPVSASRVLRGDLAGLRVTAWGPRGARAELDGVLQETAAALRVLSGAFVDYPWRELDIVAVPLGAGAGGMEWPGAIWVEEELFGGGVPGLGGLANLLTGPGAPGGEVGLMLATLREWTIAHEVGHQWWHVVVGNDSVLDPVVDEPLAQYSACLVVREVRGPGADDVCRAQILSGFEQMRLLGDRDGAADRGTDEFDSAGQYAGLVYGKAAAFYLALERRYGRDTVAGALGEVTEEAAFAMLAAEDLRRSLGESLGHPAALDRMWRRWLHGRSGAGDLASLRQPR